MIAICVCIQYYQKTVITPALNSTAYWLEIKSNKYQNVITYEDGSIVASRQEHNKTNYINGFPCEIRVFSNTLEIPAKEVRAIGIWLKLKRILYNTQLEIDKTANETN